MRDQLRAEFVSKIVNLINNILNDSDAISSIKDQYDSLALTSKISTGDFVGESAGLTKADIDAAIKSLSNIRDSIKLEAASLLPFKKN